MIIGNYTETKLTHPKCSGVASILKLHREEHRLAQSENEVQRHVGEGRKEVHP